MYNYVLFFVLQNKISNSTDVNKILITKQLIQSVFILLREYIYIFFRCSSLKI